MCYTIDEREKYVAYGVQKKRSFGLKNSRNDAIERHIRWH